MVTTTHPGAPLRSAVLRAIPSWGAAGRRGPRRHHADAAAEHHSDRTGRTAVAVADGVGDSPAAAFAATVVADHVVRVATLDGDAALGVRACGDLLRSAGDLITGDAALVVALGPGRLGPGGGHDGWTLAWVGDCRAYAWDGHDVRPLTRDHTVAETMRGGGIAVNPRFEHVLSTSVRTALPTEIGIVRLAGAETPRSLVLVSDGVHRAVPPARLAAILGSSADRTPRDCADRIVEAAAEAGTADNATALVVDTGVGLRIPAQRAA